MAGDFNYQLTEKSKRCGFDKIILFICINIMWPCLYGMTAPLKQRMMLFLWPTQMNFLLNFGVSHIFRTEIWCIFFRWRHHPSCVFGANTTKWNIIEKLFNLLCPLSRENQFFGTNLYYGNYQQTIYKIIMNTNLG